MSESKYKFPKPKRKYFNNYCKIRSIASYLPEKILTNDEIIKQNNFMFKDSFVLKSFGVKQRRVAEDSQSDSDLLLNSSLDCLERSNVSCNQLSRLIVNKYFGDNLLPMTASKLLEKMKPDYGIQAFDVDGGISSFLYSVDLVQKFINSGDDFVLLSSGGINYRMMNKSDPRVAFLFGDAATSILFEKAKEKHILASYFYTNYEYFDLSISKSKPFNIDQDWNIIKNKNNLIEIDSYKMGSWKEAKNFYRAATIVTISYLLQESNLSIEDIDLILVTENNKELWEITLETIGFSPDKSISLLKNYGNTMSAMLPLQYDYGLKLGRIEKGMKILMISHGEGINGGGLIYKV